MNYLSIGTMSPKFRGIQITSHAEFEAVLRAERASFDARWLRERSLASERASIEFQGTCALCSAATIFTATTSGGEEIENRRRVPNWRETLNCGCSLQLISRHRAAAHFLIDKTDIDNASHVVLFGPAAGFEAVLHQRLVSHTYVGRLEREFKANGGSRHFLALAHDSADIVISLDYLQRIPALLQALKEVFRILIGGGTFVFTVPFRINSKISKSYVSHLRSSQGLLPSDSAGDVHEFGWDIFDTLRDVGFSSYSAYLYWSEEFGYMGPYNLIFSAVK